MVKLDADPEVAFGKFWIYHRVANCGVLDPPLKVERIAQERVL